MCIMYKYHPIYLYCMMAFCFFDIYRKKAQQFPATPLYWSNYSHEFSLCQCHSIGSLNYYADSFENESIPFACFNNKDVRPLRKSVMSKTSLNSNFPWVYLFRSLPANNIVPTIKHTSVNPIIARKFTIGLNITMLTYSGVPA